MRAVAVIAAAVLVGCAAAPEPRRSSTLSELPPSGRHGAPSGRVETGLATWYGREAHGGPTASGERFDMNAMTAAHKTLPLRSWVRVTNMKNGRSVELRINDRGPYARGRIIDVSLAAARLLDMVDAGVVPVRVELLR